VPFRTAGYDCAPCCAALFRRRDFRRDSAYLCRRAPTATRRSARGNGQAAQDRDVYIADEDAPARAHPPSKPLTSRSSDHERGEAVPRIAASTAPRSTSTARDRHADELGQAPEALAIGYLRNQRLVKSIDEISAVQWTGRRRRSRHMDALKGLDKKNEEAHRHHRLRPGHGVRRPDGGNRIRSNSEESR